MSQQERSAKPAAAAATGLLTARNIAMRGGGAGRDAKMLRSKSSSTPAIPEQYEERLRLHGRSGTGKIHYT